VIEELFIKADVTNSSIQVGSNNVLASAC